MTDEKDEALETLAYRAAFDAFLNAYFDALPGDNLRRLADTEHVHRTSVALSTEPNSNVVIKVTITISPVVPKSRIAELLATIKHGQVHRA